MQQQQLSWTWSDSGTWTGVGAAVLGIAIGIGAPIFYSQRDDLDEARLEDLRERNRQHYKETGRYLTDVSCSHSYVPVPWPATWWSLSLTWQTASPMFGPPPIFQCQLWCQRHQGVAQDLLGVHSCVFV